MDEKYSYYLEGELSQEKFFDGEISGYVLDSMVEDKDMYQFEKECTYFSYEEILSRSKELSPLLKVYDERVLNKAEIKLDNRNHKKDFFNARGFWVYKSNESKIKDFINQYAEIFRMTQDEELESMIFPNHNFRIHKGEFFYFDSESRTEKKADYEEYKRMENNAKSKAKVLKAQAQLHKVAAMAMFGPGNAPMSTSSSALLGGIVAGTTGAVIGASSAMEKNRKHEEFVQSYNEDKNRYLQSAAQKEEEAYRLETGSIDMPYYDIEVGEVYFAIRTIFGWIPAAVHYIEHQFDVYNDFWGTYLESLEDITSKELIESRWKSIDKYISTGKFYQNFGDINMSLIRDKLEDYCFDEVIRMCDVLIKVKVKKDEAYFLRFLAQNKICSLDYAKKNKIKCSSLEGYKEVIKQVDLETKEKIKENDNQINEKIKKEKESEKKKKYNCLVQQLENDAISIEELKEIKKGLYSIRSYKDAKDLMDDCDIRIREKEKDEIYEMCVSEINNSSEISNIEGAMKELKKLGKWRGADEQIIIGNKKIMSLKIKRLLIKMIFIVAFILFVFFSIIYSLSN